MRLLIDTDIGDDIDDILAVGWALKKGVDLVGITTVYRQARKRLAIVRDILGVAGKNNITALEGYSEPMTSYARKLGNLNYETESEEKGNDPEEAIGFILDCVKKYDDLTILAIGAQTNIAYACKRDPQTMKKAKIVIMGGSFFTHTDEWNIACDPIAAKIVLDTCDNITYVPWDVTRDICIGKDNYDKILNMEGHDLSGCIAEFVVKWDKNNSYIPLLHDPTAFYYCLYPEYFTLSRTTVKIETEGDCMGMTLNLNYLCGGVKDWSLCKTIDVVKSADSAKIINEFMKDVFNV